LEGPLHDQTAVQLAARGHDVDRWTDGTWKAGGVCAIMVDAEKRLLHAGADPRRAGRAKGR